MRFVHDTLPQRVCFGSGEAASSLGREIARLGAGRVMLIASENTMHLADEIAAGHAGNLACKVRTAGGDQCEGVGAAGAPIK